MTIPGDVLQCITETFKSPIIIIIIIIATSFFMYYKVLCSTKLFFLGSLFRNLRRGETMKQVKNYGVLTSFRTNAWKLDICRILDIPYSEVFDMGMEILIDKFTGVQDIGKEAISILIKQKELESEGIQKHIKELYEIRDFLEKNEKNHEKSEKVSHFELVAMMREKLPLTTLASLKMKVMHDEDIMEDLKTKLPPPEGVTDLQLFNALVDAVRAVA